MGLTSRAHRGVATSATNGHSEGFEEFCARQRSRVANNARNIQRRYVSRILTFIVDEQPDVTVKGYGIGGGPHRYPTDD